MKILLTIVILFAANSTLCMQLATTARKQQPPPQKGLKGAPTAPYVSPNVLKKQLAEEREKNKRLVSQLQQANEQRKRLCEVSIQTENLASARSRFMGAFLYQILEEKKRQADLKEVNEQLTQKNKQLEAERSESIKNTRALWLKIGTVELERQKLEQEFEKCGQKRKSRK